MCGCGHFSSITLYGSIPGLVFGSVLFLGSDKELSRPSILSFDWIFSFAALGGLALLLGKGIKDVMWDSHFAVLPMGSANFDDLMRIVVLDQMR